MDSQSKPRRNVINYREFRGDQGNQGDVGSNPAHGTKSFSSNENVIQRVVRPYKLSSIIRKLHKNNMLRYKNR